MADLSNLYLYRITHLQNIPHILQHGITHITSANRNHNYVPIGDGTLITTRAFFPLPNGRWLGDYIPFYFGTRMPMLYVIQHGFNGVTAAAPEDIVYCVTTVQHIQQTGLEYVFTDGHAVDGLSSFYSPDDVQNIENIIDKTAISKRFWNDENDLDLKRRKEAEFLLLGDLPASAILGFAVYTNATAEIIKQMQGFGDKKLSIRPKFYF
jgi:ssDNA thymidine ADP-ribosyltransferase, DarT